METIKTEVRAATLAAALQGAGVKDVRFYLNGVFLDLEAGRIVGTDGNMMIICEGPRVLGAGGHILPREAVEVIVKGKKPEMVTVEITPQPEVDGCWRPATFALTRGAVRVAGTCIDGRYPEWQRVIPTLPADDAPAVIEHFDPALLARGLKAFNLYRDAKHTHCKLEHCGADKAGLLHYGEPGCAVVVMPLRLKDVEVAPVTAWLKGEA